jgi:hypothetical protein
MRSAAIAAGIFDRPTQRMNRSAGSELADPRPEPCSMRVVARALSPGVRFLLGTAEVHELYLQPLKFVLDLRKRIGAESWHPACPNRVRIAGRNSEMDLHLALGLVDANEAVPASMVRGRQVDQVLVRVDRDCVLRRQAETPSRAVAGR